MILTLDELIRLLKPAANPNDDLQGIYVRFAPSPKPRTKYEQTVQTIDYRTPDGNTAVQVDVDQNGDILGIEISP
jgi:uncharacterized protein YuzE